MHPLRGALRGLDRETIVFCGSQSPESELGLRKDQGDRGPKLMRGVRGKSCLLRKGSLELREALVEDDSETPEFAPRFLDRDTSRQFPVSHPGRSQADIAHGTQRPGREPPPAS